MSRTGAGRGAARSTSTCSRSSDWLGMSASDVEAIELGAQPATRFTSQPVRALVWLPCVRACALAGWTDGSRCGGRAGGRVATRYNL